MHAGVTPEVPAPAGFLETFSPRFRKQLPDSLFFLSWFPEATPVPLPTAKQGPTV